MNCCPSRGPPFALCHQGPAWAQTADFPTVELQLRLLTGVPNLTGHHLRMADGSQLFYASEDAADEERERRVSSGTHSLITIAIRLDYFTPALKSSVHSLDGQSFSLGPPVTCLSLLSFLDGCVVCIVRLLSLSVFSRFTPPCALEFSHSSAGRAASPPVGAPEFVCPSCR